MSTVTVCNVSSWGQYWAKVIFEKAPHSFSLSNDTLLGLINNKLNKQLKTELPYGQHSYTDVHEESRPQEVYDRE